MLRSQYEGIKSSIPYRALSKQRVLPCVSVAIYMQDKEPEGAGDKLEEEDEWQLYASAGYASSELESEEKVSEEAEETCEGKTCEGKTTSMSQIYCH